MGDETVPNDSLEGFGMRCNMLRVDRRYYEAGVCDLCSVATIAPDDTEYPSHRSPSRASSALTRLGTHPLLTISTTDRKDEKGVSIAEVAHA